MIVERLIDPLILFLWKTVAVIPDIPKVPEQLSKSITSFFDLIFDNSGLVGFFVPVDLIKIALPVALVIVNFEHIYKLFIWIINKIPFIGID